MNRRQRVEHAVSIKKLCKAFLEKPENIAGGNLHIVLDDGNLDDNSIQFCIDLAEKNGDKDGAELGRKLLELELHERDWVTKGS